MGILSRRVPIIISGSKVIKGYGVVLVLVVGNDTVQAQRLGKKIKAIDARDRGIGEEKSGQQVSICYDMADNFVFNDGTIEDLRKKSIIMLAELGVV